MITDDDIDKALDFLRNKSEQHAIDKANRIYMEQFTKTVLANEMLKLTDEKWANDDKKFVLDLLHE